MPDNPSYHTTHYHKNSRVVSKSFLFQIMYRSWPDSSNPRVWRYRPLSHDLGQTFSKHVRPLTLGSTTYRRWLIMAAVEYPTTRIWRYGRPFAIRLNGLPTERATSDGVYVIDRFAADVHDAQWPPWRVGEKYRAAECFPSLCFVLQSLTSSTTTVYGVSLVVFHCISFATFFRIRKLRICFWPPLFFLQRF